MGDLWYGAGWAGEARTMSTIRVHKARNYSVISNAILSDKRLSWEARGMAAFILTKPNDWVMRVGHLVTQGPCGKDKVWRILGELQACGYLTRNQVHNPDGTFRWEHTLYEEPQRGEEVQPCTEKPCMANPPIVNTEISKREISKEISIPPPTKRRKRGSFAPLEFKREEWEESALWLRKFLLEEQEAFTTPESKRLLTLDMGWWVALDKQIGEVIELQFLREQFSAMKRWMLDPVNRPPSESRVLTFVGGWMTRAVERQKRLVSGNQTYQR